MQRTVDLFYRFLELLLVLLLSGMVVMVFLNVVLRYGFNSGVTVSEELSRYFFVWLTFIGAVVTFREGSHLGIETLVSRLSRKGRITCMILVNVLIMLVSAIFFLGTWKQLPINATMHAPVSGLRMSWVFGVGMFTGGMMFLIAAERLFRIVTGRVTDDEISAFAGEHTIEQLMERGE
ncbi:TRAP transporter small permease [Qingshengfaniella alkalisoli]|uniref:TRAP transporter small permease protein n=1 Tax=Qingshengfaniella alkalisoli TaxID=2599296 RepID=A0A5B8JBV4_9RHOB|nr:TRAP transporter small permease [Qingshengfaniella alkalisoli]QDY71580.1 TRAP transporter small permease [Qingshengfaniella alkalisoli]